MIRVAVVDDHEMVRRGIISYLATETGIEVIGEAGSGNEAVKLVLKERPEIVLMDLLMDNGNGIEATRQILKSYSECKVIIITSFYDDEQIFPAIEAGAFSYMLKTANAAEVVNAIKKAAQGEPVIESKVAGKMVSRFREKEKSLMMI